MSRPTPISTLPTCEYPIPITTINSNECIGDSLSKINNNFSGIDSTVSQTLETLCQKINELTTALNWFIDNPAIVPPIGSIIPFRIPTSPYTLIVNGIEKTYSGASILSNITTDINEGFSMVTIDGNWAVCNGSSSTLDLRGNFIIGAGQDHNNNNYIVQQQAIGANTVALSNINQIPQHNHSYDKARVRNVMSTRRFALGGGHPFLSSIGAACSTSRPGEGGINDPSPDGANWNNPIIYNSRNSGNSGATSPQAHENKPRSTALIYLQRIL